MIRKWKTKKLIMQVIAFLLMFTLTFGNFDTYKAHAIELQDGDTCIVKLSTVATCTYTIEAEYNGGTWTITNTENQIRCNGLPANQPSFWLSLIKSYCSETRSETAKQMVVNALEFYVQETGRTVSSDRVSGRDNNTVCFKENNEVKWGKPASGSSYKDVLLDGNPGEISNALMIEDMHINNPLTCVSASQMDDAMKGLLVDGTPITAMTDSAWLSLILSSTNVPTWINITYNTNGGAISADASGYYAKLEIPDAESSSGNILIKVYNKSDTNVIDFKFGEITEKGKYRETTYSSASTSKVYILDMSSGVYLSLISLNAAQNLSLYKTAGGQTIDTYFNKIKRENFLNERREIECYVAIKDAALNMVNIFGATEAQGDMAVLTKLCSVDLGILDDIFGEGRFQVTNGDWVFELADGQDEVVLAYKEGDPDPAANGWYFYLSELKALRIKDDEYYDLMVPTKEKKNGTKLTTQPSNINIPFSILSGNPPDKDSKPGISASRYALFEEILSGNTVYCSARTLKIPGKVGTNEKALEVVDTYKDGTEPTGFDYPPAFPINDFMLLTDEMQDQIGGDDPILDDIYAQLGDNKTEIKHAFVDDVLKYGKIVIMFLLLLAIVYTAILSIQSSGDIKKRVLIKERLKDISIGTIMFACIIPIYNLVAHFVNDAYTSLGEFTGEYSGPIYYATISRFKVGYIVKFIGNVLDLVTKGLNWLIDGILSHSMQPGVSTNLMELLYKATEDDGVVSSILPFTQGEWNLYMMGYRLLTALFVGFLAIASVKIAFDFIIGAGNPSKIEAAKESIKRMFVACLVVILAPYGLRLLLLFFNYMTSMLPIDGSTARFDIDFESAGFVGSVANLLFATTRLKIFVQFFVRKVMIALMLFSTPFICGVWAVSNKFRSFNLWVGTLLSNCALQFCYALVFMVVILISYDGQNPFIKLIVVILIPKFAAFFSQSLQGLGQVWGGINSERIADDVVDFYKGAGRKAVGAVKGTGKFMQNYAHWRDPHGKGKWTRRINNAGAIMSLDVEHMLDKKSGIRTKGDTLRNRVAEAEDNYKKDKIALDSAARNRKMALTGRTADDKVFQYNNAMEEGNFELADSLREDGAEFDIIDDYYKAKEKSNLSENLYEGLNARAQSDKFKDQGYLGTVQAKIKRGIDKSMYSEIDELYNRMQQKVSDSIETNRQRSGSDDSLAKLLNRSEIALRNKINGNQEKTEKQINTSVDTVFNELISYMEHSENRTTVNLQITDAIFEGLFAKKTEVNGFSPDMAIKYQNAKDQYFGDVDNMIIKATQKTEQAEAMATTKSEDVHVTREEQKPLENANNTPENNKPRSSDDTGAPRNDVGESMLGVGGSVLAEAGGSVLTEAGGSVINNEFSVGNDTQTGFEVNTETYASEHGAEGEGNKVESKPKDEVKSQQPLRNDSAKMSELTKRPNENIASSPAQAKPSEPVPSEQAREVDTSKAESIGETVQKMQNETTDAPKEEKNKAKDLNGVRNPKLDIFKE